MLNIALCDDEKHELSFLRNEIKNITSQMTTEINISTYDNSTDILKIIEENPNSFDMLFLDMYIDEKIGLDIARTVRTKNNRCVIIFITAFADRMAECFEWKASAYLTKPVDKENLARAFQTGLTHLSHAPTFFVSVKGTDMAIPFDEIMYFENRLKSVILHRVDGNEISFPGTVGVINAPEEYFHLCHNSFLVNFSYVEMLDKSKHDVVMKNGVRIHISRAYYAGIVAAFTNFHSIIRR